MGDPYQEFGGQAVSVSSDPYAEFGGKAAPKQPTAQATGTISRQPGGVLPWLQSLDADVRSGSGNTLPGRLLQKLGAPGLESGVSKGAAEQGPGSLILGPINAAEGIAETPRHPIAGPLHAASGVLQAATIPAAFVGPGAAKNALEAIPSKAHAEELFRAVAGDANKVPVAIDNAQQAALKLMDWQRKTQLGPTLNKFLNRITSAKQGPMTYEESRDFYQLLNDIRNKSYDGNIKVLPSIRFEINKLVVGLRQDIGNAAGQVGRAADYYDAMSEFHKSAQLRRFATNAFKYLVVPSAAGTAAGAGFRAYTGMTK